MSQNFQMLNMSIDFNPLAPSVCVCWNGAKPRCVNVHRPSFKPGLDGNAVRARTHLPDQPASSAEVTWGQYKSHTWDNCGNPPAAFPLWISISHSRLLVGFEILKHFFQLFLPSVSITPSPSAPPVRLCPPLSSPEDAGVNLFTAAGFLSYVQSTTRRAYQQVLEVLDNSHRRWFLFLAPGNFQFVHIHKIFLHDINHILMSLPGPDQSIFV